MRKKSTAYEEDDKQIDEYKANKKDDDQRSLSKIIFSMPKRFSYFALFCLINVHN